MKTKLLKQWEELKKTMLLFSVLALIAIGIANIGQNVLINKGQINLASSVTTMQDAQVSNIIASTSDISN